VSGTGHRSSCCMTMRFYFDTINGGRSVDEEGQELPSADHVEDQAVRALVDLGRDELLHSIKSGKVSVVVRDETGKSVLSASIVLFIERHQFR
jgi:hypothetical protein